MGLRPPSHFDGLSMVPLLLGRPTTWRDAFLCVYYWGRNFPQSPTVFALRGDRYKFIDYYGLWDAGELYDLETDPEEQHNLRYDPDSADLAASMEADLYARMEALGGMEMPLNAPLGRKSRRRYRSRGGQEAADFPNPLIVDEPRPRAGGKP